MAVLWFVHAEAMYGYSAYHLAIDEIIPKLGGERAFKFVCRLDQPPERAREHNRDHVATYDRVLLELAADELGQRCSFMVPLGSAQDSRFICFLSDSGVTRSCSSTARGMRLISARSSG